MKWQFADVDWRQQSIGLVTANKFSAATKLKRSLPPNYAKHAPRGPPWEGAIAGALPAWRAQSSIIQIDSHLPEVWRPSSNRETASKSEDLPRSPARSRQPADSRQLTLVALTHSKATSTSSYHDDDANDYLTLTRDHADQCPPARDD